MLVSSSSTLCVGRDGLGDSALICSYTVLTFNAVSSVTAKLSCKTHGRGEVVDALQSYKHNEQSAGVVNCQADPTAR
jgi:hypothetical protein